jgi:adenosylhomocysteine nucleosidase
MRLNFIFLFLILPVSLFGQKIGIIGAMPEEIRILTENLEEKKVVKYKDLTFYEGKLQNKNVVIMKAGIGKVNAAYSTALLLEKYPINEIIFTGVAGGLHPDALPGDIVVGDSIFHHDYARHLANDEYLVRPTQNIANNQLNPLYFASDSTLLAKAKKVIPNLKTLEVGGHNPKIFIGKIATGDVFLSNSVKAKWLYTTFGALATEMEGAAIAQIAYHHKVPFMIIRSCSDNANNDAHLDFQIFMKPAAENAIRLVLAILKD